MRRAISLTLEDDSSFYLTQVFTQVLKPSSNPLFSALGQLLISMSILANVQGSFLLPTPSLKSISVQKAQASTQSFRLYLKNSHYHLTSVFIAPESCLHQAFIHVRPVMHIHKPYERISSFHLSFTEPSIFNSLTPVLEMVDLNLDLRGCISNA